MTDHLNVFQSIVNRLVAMKMTLNDEMQTSLLLCSLLDSWETFVVTISNSIPNGALSMKLMKGNLFNKQTKRKTYDIRNAQTIIIKSRRRNKNRRQKSHDKVEERSQSRNKIKCFHCRKNRHMKRNYRTWKNRIEQNQEKEDEKNITTYISNGGEVLMLSNECLHVDEQRVE